MRLCGARAFKASSLFTNTKIKFEMLKIVSIACLVVSLLGRVNAEDYDDEKIIRGYEARPHQFPWQVGLHHVYDDEPPEPGFFCGGSILDKTHVLTAAHCVRWHSNESKLNIEAGAHNSSALTEPTRQVVRVCGVKTHPGIKEVTPGIFAYDFALLTLAKPLVFNRAVRPIRLPPDNIDYSRLICIVTGWGESRFNRSTEVRKELLQALNVTIVDSEECKKIARTNLGSGTNQTKDLTFMDTIVCSRPDPESRSACSGDSGGPLACWDAGGPYLLGAVSFGPGDCQRKGLMKFGTAFAKVPVGKDWITCKS